VLGELAQVALDRPPTAPREHLDYAPTIQIGHHGGQLAPAPVTDRIEGEPSHRARLGQRHQRQGASHLERLVRSSRAISAWAPPPSPGRPAAPRSGG
jgi:hypothetical protein